MYKFPKTKNQAQIKQFGDLLVDIDDLTDEIDRADFMEIVAFVIADLATDSDQLQLHATLVKQCARLLANDEKWLQVMSVDPNLPSVF
jgi:hypothetical protein